jgi:hypothetical protein
LANESALQMKAFALPVPLRLREASAKQGLGGIGSIVLYTSGSRVVSIASWFPVIRFADAMVADCKLLVDLWSENQNEHCQL